MNLFIENVRLIVGGAVHANTSSRIKAEALLHHFISPPSSLSVSFSHRQRLKKKMVDIDNGICSIQYNFYPFLTFNCYLLQTLLTEIEL